MFWGLLFYSPVWTDGNGGTDPPCLPAMVIVVVIVFLFGGGARFRTEMFNKFKFGFQHMF